MTDYTTKNPGLEVHNCDRLQAHGPHEWDFGDHLMVWCEGLRAHPATMIGGRRG